MNNRWQKLQELFHQAELLQPNEIDAFLDKECGSDDELKKEIKDLLDLSSLDNPLLTDQVIGAAQEMTQDTVQAGMRIGAYKIISELGKGGMGTVYLAERADESYQQLVAIKLISSHRNTEEITKRFVAERQILAQLTHPNIARLLDGGTIEAGDPYFAMEYIKGKAIIDHCDVNKLNIKQRLSLFVDVCSALSYAHRKLVLHRDIKPSNIIISEDGEPKLLDFGIAKLLTTKGGDPAITGIDQMIMTPEYASPEQIMGQSMGVASDIYQLGLVLYQLFTGQKAQVIEQKYYLEVKEVIVDQQPLSPSAQISTTQETNLSSSQDIAKDRGTIPEKLLNNLKGDLDTIVLKCLNKDPEHRYHTVNDLTDDIQAYLNFRPIKARGLSRAYRINRFIRRHWIGVTATTVTALALVGGLTFSLIFLQQTKVAEKKAEVAAQLAETEAETANQVSQFLIDMISDADPNNSNGETITVKEILNRSAIKIDNQTIQPRIKAKLYTVIASAYNGLSKLNKAESIIQKSVNIAEKIKPFDPKTLIEALITRASIKGYLGQMEIAINDAKRAVLISRQNDLLTPKSLVALSGYLFSSGQYSDSKKLLVEALSMLDSNNEDKTLENKITIYNRLGLLSTELLDYKQAEKYLLKAVPLLKLVPNLRFEVKNSFHLGQLYIGMYRYEEAEVQLKKSLKLSKKLYGDKHNHVVIALSILGEVQTYLYKTIDAEKTLVEALEIAKNNFGTESYYNLHLLQKYSGLKYLQGDYSKAVDIINSAIKIADQSHGEKHVQRNTTYAYILRPLYELGRVKETNQTANEILTNLREYYPPNHGFLLFTKVYLGLTKVANAEFDEAMKIANELKVSAIDRFVFSGLEIMFNVNHLIGDFSMCKEILDQYNQKLNTQDPNKVVLEKPTYSKMLILYQLATNQLTKANGNISKAISQFKEKQPGDHPEIQKHMIQRAIYFSKTNNHEKAVNIAKSAFNKWLNFIDVKENSTAILALSYAEILINASKTQEAKELLDQHIPSLEKAFDETHYQRQRAQCLLGKTLIQEGQIITGEDKIKRAHSILQTKLGPNSPLVKNCK